MNTRLSKYRPHYIFCSVFIYLKCVSIAIIAKFRIFVPKYEESNIRSLVQYGVLVHGCTSFIAVKLILLLHEGIVRPMRFRDFNESYRCLCFKINLDDT